MTDEEFVIKMYEAHCEALNDVWHRQMTEPWQTLKEPIKQLWLRLAGTQHLIQATTTVQELLTMLAGYGFTPMTYSPNNPDPLMLYAKRFYELVKAIDWMATTIPSTGILAPSKYKLKSSDRKFIIQGWIQMDGKPKSVSIKFLDNGLIMDIPQTDFDAEAVKID